MSYNTLGLWLRLECSLDSLSIDSAHVIYVSEGYDVAYNHSQWSNYSNGYGITGGPRHNRVTWYYESRGTSKPFRNVNYVC